MPLTLVLGPANSAKAGHVLGAYADAAPQGALLVVPTLADASHYARELAGTRVAFGSVTTFAGLAGEIARRTGYSAPRLSPLARRRAVRRAVARAERSALEQSAASGGFAVAAETLIADLQNALVSPQRLAAALQAWAAEEGPGRERRAELARELGELYRGYRRELERLGRVDGELFAWRALDELRADPGRWAATPVFFYGFDDLTGLERDAVETLARVARAPVTVSLTYEPGRAAFAARAQTVEELRPLAERVIELDGRDEHYAPGSRTALHGLERRLFRELDPGVDRLDPGEAIRLLEAGGELAEAELIGAEVLELLRGGIPAEEIVIVCRSLERSAPLLERVLGELGVSVAVERSVPLGFTTLGRAVRALARCAWDPGAGAGDVLDLLRAPGVAARAADVDALEFSLRRAGVADASSALGRWGPLPALDALAAAAPPDGAPASSVAAAALLVAAQRLLAAAHGAVAPELARDAELDARALAVLGEAVRESEELGERLTGPELLALLDELSVPAGQPVRAGAVLLADPLGIRARRFRAVFVYGLQEGEFPRPGAPEPFLSDQDRLEIARASALRLGVFEDALARERYLFYAAVSRCTEQLVLSYRSSDEEGNLALASPFLADVEDVLLEGWTERRRRRLLADVVWAPEEAPTERALRLARAAAGAPPAGEPAAPVRRLAERALAGVRHREVVSGGALESYGDCPVKWLVEKELAPNRFEPEPEPLTRGSYMHAVLELLLGRLGAAVSEAALPRARELLEEVMAELPPPEAGGRSEPLRAALLESIRADLLRYLEHEAASGCGWTPARLELKFGFEEGEQPLPALALGEGEQATRLRGVIDRIDVDPSGRRAIVRDYKSGGARPDYPAARWEAEHRLQVGLYMLAVRRLLGLEPVAGLYHPLGGGDLRPRGVFRRDTPVGARVVGSDAREPEEIDELLAGVEAAAAELAARLRSGELVPCPQTCSRDGCRYPGICRSS